MTPETAARIVEQSGTADFVRLLREVDDDFRDAAFEPALGNCGGRRDRAFPR